MYSPEVGDRECLHGAAAGPCIRSKSKPGIENGLLAFTDVQIASDHPDLVKGKPLRCTYLYH